APGGWMHVGAWHLRGITTVGVELGLPWIHVFDRRGDCVIVLSKEELGGYYVNDATAGFLC
ncbi:MAG TPA: hypothetical protein VEG60_06005, partial [Candidatus Binatia bacterium]|nr:hypothetical protein [Candidatus Binatia bacterium]